MKAPVSHPSTRALRGASLIFMLLLSLGLLSPVVYCVALPPESARPGLEVITGYNASSLMQRQDAALNGNPTYAATITAYGSAFGSGTCMRNSVSCGFTTGGYTAALSQNLFGASSGYGPACWTCWYVCVSAQLDGAAISNAGHCIMAVVNDLCPATASNPLCSNPSLTSPNSYGAVVDIDLCYDSGAPGALFPPGVNAARGWITKGDCAGYVQTGGRWEN